MNPTAADLERSELDLIVAGTQQGVLMVESEAQELSEETMLGAVTFGHKHFQPVIEAIIDLAETCAKEPWAMAEPLPLLVGRLTRPMHRHSRLRQREGQEGADREERDQPVGDAAERGQ